MPKTYTTMQGDTFDIIALRQLGSELYMSDIIAANPAHRETVIFPADVVLVMPDIPAGSKLVSLPLWKR